ncbi:unnamed protein product [Jaminaea pallidilutea]
MAPRSNGAGTSSPASSSPAATQGSGGPTDPTKLPSVSPGGSYDIEAVRPGCKLFVQKPDLATGEMEERRAEVLSRREKYRGRQKRGEEKEEAAIPPEAKWEFYVHYEEFNKRLDEWVLGTRLIISREIEWPKPADQGVGGHGSHKKKAPTRSGTSTPAPSTPGANVRVDGIKEKDDLLRKAAKNATLKRKEREDSGTVDAQRKGRDADGSDADGSEDTSMADGEDSSNEDGAVVAMELLGGGDESMDVTQDGPPSAAAGTSAESYNAANKRDGPPISKEQEIEKLRTSGSMTQSVSEVARVKNFDCIQMGAHEVETWYFSPYPVEYAVTGKLFICEMCLSYFPSGYTLKRHRTKCKLTHPPGNEIYRHEDISFFEIDGRKQKTWCRNLCLLSKCFLDHKTLYYDVDPFLYYVMAQRDDTGCHTIGYFSKEKESAEGYNVACILTLPQHQRSGFGRLLIDFSYELSKREHKLGSPEKPLSDLGLLGYRAYWAETIVGYLLDKGDGEETSIDEVAWKTCITHADVLHTCTSLNMLKQFQGKHYLVLNDSVLANHEKQMAKRKRRIKGENLNWIPPVFSRAQLQFGW